MRTDGRRKKKLIIAFHFQSSDQARWKCETCRTTGLETKRNCGFLGQLQSGREKVVWTRKQASTTRCPKSVITPQSLQWLEEFFAWKFAGRDAMGELSAKDVDAFCTLETELRAEAGDGYE